MVLDCCKLASLEIPMITVKTLRHVANASVIPSFRSCPSWRRLDTRSSDRARMASGMAQVLAQEARRQWCQLNWQHRTNN